METADSSRKALNQSVPRVRKQVVLSGRDRNSVKKDTARAQLRSKQTNRNGQVKRMGLLWHANGRLGGEGSEKGRFRLSVGESVRVPLPLEVQISWQAWPVVVS